MITNAAHQFIERHLQAVWQLELIILVRESQAPLSVTDISRRLYLASHIVGPVVRRLTESGVFRVSLKNFEKYIYAPITSDLARTIDDVVGAYAERPIAVIELICTKKRPPATSC